MSGSASLDLRYPIGELFTVLGVLLAGFGLATRGNTNLYAPAGNLNINLLWGVVMLVFGLLFVALAWWSGRTGGRGRRARR
ncbi:MAG: hypothetical protein IT359_12950 [Gemmatimonadaceae bacterium]|nr:hypothetical protein [Gemmatimonadaceae bacterium]